MRALAVALTLVALAAHAPAGGAAAQQAPPDPLGPAAAVAYAREHSPEYRRVLNDIDVARASTRAAWGAFLPSLALGASTDRYSSSTVTGEDEAGRPITFPDPVDYTRSSSSQSIGLDMTLFDGGASFQELGAARAEAAATRARIDESAVALDARVLTLYWQAVQRERAIEVESRLLAAAHERHDAIQRMVAIAAAGPEDVLGAEVDVATQELALERARATAARAVIALLEAMGAPLDVAPTLDAELSRTLDPAALHEDALVERALARHPSIVAADAAIEAADESADAARAGYWPRISGNAGWGRSAGASSDDALFDLNPQNTSFSFGLSASLPIFQGFQAQLASERAHAALDDARAERHAARLAVAAGVRGALLDLRTAWRALEIAERVATLSADRLAMAHERYRNGALGFTELQAVVARADQAERDALDARFEYEIARVALEEAVGGPV